MVHAVYLYFKTCDSFQRSHDLPKYRKTISMPLTTLLDIFSIDFAGTLPTATDGSHYALIAAEKLTVWPLVIATKDETSRTVANFLDKEIIRLFGPPGIFVYDNATCFGENSLTAFLGQSWTRCSTVLVS